MGHDNFRCARPNIAGRIHHREVNRVDTTITAAFALSAQLDRPAIRSDHDVVQRVAVAVAVLDLVAGHLYDHDAAHWDGAIAVVLNAGHKGIVWVPVNVNVGASVSNTVTVWVQEAWLPEPSVAVQVMVVVPFGYGAFNGWPSLRVPVTVGVPQLSVAVGWPGLTVAEQVPGSLPWTTGAGQIITGFS
jgi:hypothetical protein